MTCRHAKGDPACGSTVGGSQWRENERYHEESVRKTYEARIAALPQTPDSARYEIEQSHREGPHLVLKVRYPNCVKCSYEGVKVLVLLDVTEAAALRWRVIDPHFADPSKPRKPAEAPAPAARFPASEKGWADAIGYVRRQMP